MFTRIFFPAVLSAILCQTVCQTAAAQTEAMFPKQELGTQPPVLTGTATLSEEELQAGWIHLFDGVSTYGWTALQGTVAVKDGVLISTGVSRFNVPFSCGVDLITKRQSTGGTSPGKADETTAENKKAEVRIGTGQLYIIKLQPQAMKPLFDGKTLTNWKIQGKAEAKVEDGAIRLTGGSGSLESEGKYADFVLQLEYKTDKPVNSGVFFRCIPNEMMNGYECQVFNNPPADDYKKFIGTDTGGIFRRQVGRNAGAKDGQWNYLTIVAAADRIATWVNGIQVSDYQDTRKADVNPRKGKRTEAGTIQFQGHDASTDILFRNIRIGTL